MSLDNVNQNATEGILGQFCYALGQGAGTMRIQREAITALRARYTQPVSMALDRWPTLAPNILSFVTQIGRVAALQATQQGRTAISATHFTYARRLVESQVHESGDRTHGIFAGVICPAVPGEALPQSEMDTDGPGTDGEALRPLPIVASPASTIN